MEGALNKNAADEEQLKDAKKKEKRQAEREEDDLLVVLAQRHGRRFLWRLIGECGLYSDNPTGNQFQEGQRHVGLKLLQKVMDAAPDAYLQMIIESREDANA